MPYSTLPARLLAALCWVLSGQLLGPALQLWKQHYKESKHGLVKSARSLITTWGPRLVKYGTLQNWKRSRNPRKVPDAVAKTCCEVLKQGHIVKQQTRDLSQPPVEVHRYWTSIKVACQESAYLNSILIKYQVTPSALLRRMHQVDPKLRRRRLKMKWNLTAQQKQQRQGIARQLLTMVDTIPNFLKRIFFIDECSIWLTASNVNVKVYADAHDDNASAVMHIPGLEPNTKIKVHIFAVVNALLGPFFIDFTTGTTQLRRRHIHPTAPFQVSKGWSVPRAETAVLRSLQGLGFK